MIKNQILLERMCKLIAQTYAVPIPWICERAKEIGVEAIVEILEHQNENKPKF